MVPSRFSGKPAGRGVSVAAELGKVAARGDRLEEAPQESPDSLEQSAEESADAREQAADGTYETAYHAHLSITLHEDVPGSSPARPRCVRGVSPSACRAR